MITKPITDFAQTLMVARFEFKFDDVAKTAGDSEADFGKTNIAATVFPIIDLPPGSVVVGGDITVYEAFDAVTYTLLIGDLVDPDRYLVSADKKAVGRTALLVTGYEHPGGIVGMSVTAGDVCTTGRAVVSLQYVIKYRATESLN